MPMLLTDNDIGTPIPVTWTTDSLLTQDLLNAEIRDPLRFIVSGCSCAVVMASNQSLPDVTMTNIIWDTENEDVDGIISAPSPTFTFTRNGIIAVRFAGQWGSGTGGYRAFRVSQNGTIVGGTNDSGNITQSHQHGQCVALDLPVSIGDTLQIAGFHDSGSAMSILAGTQCTLTWVGKLEDFVDFDAPPPVVPGSSKPPAANPTKHTSTYGAQWSRTYDGDNTTTWDDSNYCYQGRYSSDRGNTRSLVGFDYATIKSDLKGATRITAKLTYYTQHSFYFAGITTVIGGHGYTSKPSTWSSSVDENLQRVHSDYHKTTTVTLNSALTNGLKSGKYKGIAFGPGTSTSLGYYGYYNGANMSNEPKLTITYYK